MTQLINAIVGLSLLAITLAVSVVFIGLLFSLPVWILWNTLMPSLFGLQQISWFQAWGLLILCSFLFKSSSKKSNE